MPFTPFHLGPGALFKAVGGERFSFTIFGGSQILMDLEPLVHMIRGDKVLHGMSHTIAGGLVIALVSAAVGRPVSDALLRHAMLGVHPIGWPVAIASALIGIYSHIGLDAMMHWDMVPLWPVARGNAVLGVISIETLHLLCVIVGVLGGGVVVLRGMRDA